MEEKIRLRGEMKSLLREAPKDRPGFLGTEIREVLSRVPCILAYAPFGGEVDPSPLWQEASHRGLSVFLPRIVEPHSLEFRKLSGTLLPNTYGIGEPTEAQPLFPGADNFSSGVVLVPGLAFDSRGNRLGRGKGYYDRFLSTLPKSWITLGVGWEFQLRDFVPTDPWDYPLNGVVVPGRLVWCS